MIYIKLREIKACLQNVELKYGKLNRKNKFIFTVKLCKRHSNNCLILNK